jgi:hypothetical protein
MIPTLQIVLSLLLRVLSVAALWIMPTGVRAQTPTQITPRHSRDPRNLPLPYITLSGYT